MELWKEGKLLKDQLIHMRDKLNDISKRNRSIRLLRLQNKWSFDLVELEKLIKCRYLQSSTIVEQVIKHSKKEITLLQSYS